MMVRSIHQPGIYHLWLLRRSTYKSFPVGFLSVAHHYFVRRVYDHNNSTFRVFVLLDHCRLQTLCSVDWIDNIWYAANWTAKISKTTMATCKRKTSTGNQNACQNLWVRSLCLFSHTIRSTFYSILLHIFSDRILCLAGDINSGIIFILLPANVLVLSSSMYLIEHVRNTSYLHMPISNKWT